MKRISTAIFILLFFPINALAVALTNPLATGGKNPSVPEIIGRIINGAMSVVGAITLLMFVYGGFLWLTSGGNEAQIAKGKKVIVWSVLGIVLIASAFVLTNALFAGLSTGTVSP